MIKEITSAQNTLVKHLVRLRQNSDYRIEHNSAIITGIKMISELPANCRIKNLLITEEYPIHNLDNNKIEETFFTTETILQKITGLSHTEGVVAEIDLPASSSLEGLHKIVALDGINDPGNIGTIIRTALALGWQGIFLLNNTCDPYNDKAIRAAKGATFRIPLRMGSINELKEIIKNNQLTPIAANISGEDVSHIKDNENLLLVLGSESHGLSSEIKTICKEVTIPIGNMESLNVSVAGGIIMYILRENK